MSEESPQAPQDTAQAPESAPEIQVSEPISTPPPGPIIEQHTKPAGSNTGNFQRNATVANVVILLATCVFIASQWHEMRSSSADTHALAVAAGKQTDAIGKQAASSRDLADRMKDQADNTLKLYEQAKRSADSAQQSVRDGQVTAYHQLRPYVSVSKMDFVGDMFKGERIKGKAFVVNSGRTPAVNITGCGDIVLRPNSQPMTDDFPCPAPNNPKRPNRGEYSHFNLGSGADGYSVDSPGTTIIPGDLTIEEFKGLVSSGLLRIYFYGHVHYADILDPKVVHHTTFCGRYNAVTASLDICEKHNRMD